MEPKTHEVVARRTRIALAGYEGDEATARTGLDDPNGDVRATALGALARLGRLGPEDILRHLGDPEPVVRRRACDLSAVADPEAVLPLLDDVDHLVVEAACFALGERGTAAPGAVASALSVVARGHRDPLCREAAVAALGAIGSPAGLGAILAALDDKPAVRRRAVLALASFEGPEVDRALEKARSDRDCQVRQAAEDLSASASEPPP